MSSLSGSYISSCSAPQQVTAIGVRSSAEPVRDRKLSMFIDAINSELTRLETAFSDLYSAIDPVVKPCAPTPLNKDSGPTPPIQSNYAVELSCILNRITGIITGIADVTSRVEV